MEGYTTLFILAPHSPDVFAAGFLCYDVSDPVRYTKIFADHRRAVSLLCGTEISMINSLGAWTLFASADGHFDKLFKNGENANYQYCVN
jgi:hypothetical protein